MKIAASLLLVVASLGAQQPAFAAGTPASAAAEMPRRSSPADVASVGRQVRPVPFAVGERIPQFRAPDQDGNDRQFNDLVGPKGLVIFFYKSADW